MRSIVTVRVLVEHDASKAFDFVDNETKHLNIVEMYVEDSGKLCSKCGKKLNSLNKNDECFSCIELHNREVNTGFHGE